jgi:hypothetical protein
MMGELGFETWLEPVTVQHWVRGGETARIVRPARPGLPALPIAALGLSVPTPPGGISAPVVEVHSFEELRTLGLAVKGRIVFYNTPMDPRPLNTFQAYGGAVQFRSRGASEAAKLGAAAVLVRSVTLRTDDHPHAGMVAYEADAPKIPAAAISTRGADTGPLARQGAVLMGFIPDSQKYFDYHHSALDVLFAVHLRELELGAIVMAIFAYVTAQEGI